MEQRPLPGAATQFAGEGQPPGGIDVPFVPPEEIVERSDDLIVVLRVGREERHDAGELAFTACGEQLRHGPRRRCRTDDLTPRRVAPGERVGAARDGSPREHRPREARREGHRVAHVHAREGNRQLYGDPSDGKRRPRLHDSDSPALKRDQGTDFNPLCER